MLRLPIAPTLHREERSRKGGAAASLVVVKTPGCAYAEIEGQEILRLRHLSLRESHLRSG
jgi:hypothetical protein